jgi:hypothetical protein
MMKYANQDNITSINEMLWSRAPYANDGIKVTSFLPAFVSMTNNSVACRIGFDAWKIASLNVTFALPVEKEIL